MKSYLHVCWLGRCQRQRGTVYWGPHTVKTSRWSYRWPTVEVVKREESQTSHVRAASCRRGSGSRNFRSPFMSRKFDTGTRGFVYLWCRKYHRRSLKMEQFASSVLFCSRPRSEGWPHHGRIFSIYPCPLSFWLTLPRRVLSTSWWPSSPSCTWHCSLHYLFLQATPLFHHCVTIVC